MTRYRWKLWLLLREEARVGAAVPEQGSEGTAADHPGVRRQPGNVVQERVPTRHRID